MSNVETYNSTSIVRQKFAEKGLELNRIFNRSSQLLEITPGTDLISTVEKLSLMVDCFSDDNRYIRYRDACFDLAFANVGVQKAVAAENYLLHGTPIEKLGDSSETANKIADRNNNYFPEIESRAIALFNKIYAGIDSNKPAIIKSVLISEKFDEAIASLKQQTEAALVEDKKLKHSCERLEEWNKQKEQLGFRDMVTNSPGGGRRL